MNISNETADASGTQEKKNIRFCVIRFISIFTPHSCWSRESSRNDDGSKFVGNELNSFIGQYLHN